MVHLFVHPLFVASYVSAVEHSDLYHIKASSEVLQSLFSVSRHPVVPSPCRRHRRAVFVVLVDVVVVAVDVALISSAVVKRQRTRYTENDSERASERADRENEKSQRDLIDEKPFNPLLRETIRART